MIKVLDNVYDLVTLNMEQRFSERVALRFYDKETDEVTAVHYKDYARDIRRAVSYFQSTIPDIKGKKICLLNKNSYEYAVNTFGIILAGGVLVLLNQHKSWDELSYELGLVDPDRRRRLRHKRAAAGRLRQHPAPHGRLPRL